MLICCLLLVHNVLFAAAVLNMDFCIVSNGDVVPLASVSNLEEFPIYRNISELQFDIINRHNSLYPVSV